MVTLLFRLAVNLGFVVALQVVALQVVALQVVALQVALQVVALQVVVGHAQVRVQ